MPQLLATTEQTPRQPTYPDAELNRHMKDLRACCKPYPRAQAALERTETRLKYILRVLHTWDETHAGRAETLIRLGNPEAAQTAAQMIFDRQLRADLLGRARIGGDPDADERMLEALEMERTVLE